MNRKLKFRAWINENYESFHADQSCYNENDEFVPSMIYGDKLAFEEYMPINDLLDEIPLMQYTGMEDKNGIEIYEGDIVRAISDYYEFDFIGEVVFKDGSFAVKDDGLISYAWRYYEVEVLGNIYENPELLGGNKMKKWSELMRDNKDIIIEEMIQSFIEAEDEPLGTSISVEIDHDGNVWRTGALDCNTQSTTSWKGESFVVVSIGAWELDYNMYNLLENNLPEYSDIYDEFKKYSKHCKYISESDLPDFMLQNYPDVLDKWNRDEYTYTIESFEEDVQERFEALLEDQIKIES